MSIEKKNDDKPTMPKKKEKTNFFHKRESNSKTNKKQPNL